MKHKYILLLLLFSLLNSSKAQDYKKEFIGKTWYVTGSLWNQQPLQLTTTKLPSPDYDFVFLPKGTLKKHEITKESTFDENGNEHGPGLEFTDSTFTYTFKKNYVELHRFLPKRKKDDEEVNFSFYYKIDVLPDKKGYQFTHVTREEFKKD